MAILDRVLRAGEGKKVKALAAILPDINALAAQMSAMSEAELRGKTAEFKSRIERGETLEDLLIESFAVVREAATRVISCPLCLRISMVFLAEVFIKLRPMIIWHNVTPNGWDRFIVGLVCR
jgi:hypothetical protein